MCEMHGGPGGLQESIAGLLRRDCGEGEGGVGLWSHNENDFGAPYSSIPKALPTDLPILQARCPQHEHFRAIKHRMTPALSALFFRHAAALSVRVSVPIGFY